MRSRGPESSHFQPDSQGKEGGRERQEDEERHRKAEKGRKRDEDRKEDRHPNYDLTLPSAPFFKKKGVEKVLFSTICGETGTLNC